MNSLKDRDSVYYSYVIINFLWYALCAAAILLVGIIFAKHAFGLMPETLKIHIPIDTEQLSLQTAIDPSMISIDSATASLNSEYIMNNYFGLYIGMVVSLVIVVALSLYGFFQLRMILKS